MCAVALITATSVIIAAAPNLLNIFRDHALCRKHLGRQSHCHQIVVATRIAELPRRNCGAPSVQGVGPAHLLLDAEAQGGDQTLRFIPAAMHRMLRVYGRRHAGAPPPPPQLHWRTRVDGVPGVDARFPRKAGRRVGDAAAAAAAAASRPTTVRADSARAAPRAKMDHPRKMHARQRGQAAERGEHVLVVEHYRFASSVTCR